MKKRSTILFALAVSAALSSLYLAGCTQSTSTSTGVSTGVSVMQSGPTSAMVMWTRSSDDNGTDTVLAAIGAATLAPVLAASPAASAALTSLVMGSTYTISVHSSGGASNSVTFMLAGPPSGL